jgi:hypothetical protein
MTLTDAWMRPPKRHAILMFDIKALRRPRSQPGEPMDLANIVRQRRALARGGVPQVRRAAVVNIGVYSITSSARIRIEAGKVTPSVLAVFMLIVSVNLLAR